MCCKHCKVIISYQRHCGLVEPLLSKYPALQVQLAKTYDIRKWLALGLLRLTQRTRPLNKEDVRLVGLSDSLKICALPCERK